MTIALRISKYVPVTLTTSSTTTPNVDVSQYSQGEVAIPNGSTITTITFHTVGPTGTVYAAYDAAGTAVTMTVAANRAYPLPAAVFGAGIVRLVGNAAGAIALNLKS